MAGGKYYAQEKLNIIEEVSRGFHSGLGLNGDISINSHCISVALFN